MNKYGTMEVFLCFYNVKNWFLVQLQNAHGGLFIGDGFIWGMMVRKGNGGKVYGSQHSHETYVLEDSEDVGICSFRSRKFDNWEQFSGGWVHEVFGNF